MIIIDQQWEENFQEYLQLLQDPSYDDVIFDDHTGGVSAIHKNHRFNNKTGAFGIKQGEYEKLTVECLRKRGHVIRLESEMAPIGVKTPDGTLDGIVMDIKAIEGHGKWAIKDKFHDAKKQGVECVILYFHKKELYSLERVEDGWNKYLNDYSSQKYTTAIKQVLCIVENNIIEYPVQ